MDEPHGEADLDRVMQQLDPDASGTISFEEFRDSWIQNHQYSDGDDRHDVAVKIASGSRKAAQEERRGPDSKG